MIEVDQPQHLCRREPERGDEALEASPDPGRAVGDEEHLVSGVEADLPRVRQQQGEDRLRPFFVLGPRFLRLTRTRPPSRETTTRFPVTRSSRPHAALCWAARARAA